MIGGLKKLGLLQRDPVAELDGQFVFIVSCTCAGDGLAVSPMHEPL